jgi:pyrroline-5-carboxylate reductase
MDLSNQTARLTFIGAGNMATAIIGGLRTKNYPASLLKVCGPESGQLTSLATTFGVTTSHLNSTFLDATDLLLLCVKPQIMQAVCADLATHLQQRELAVVSIAAGVNTAQLREWLNTSLPVVRCMPNTPAMIHEGATGIYVPDNAGPPLKTLVQTIFGAIGIVAWVEKEADLHAVTALSGSGPAYCFLFLQALEDVGARMGLTPEVARKLAIQTMKGSGILAEGSRDSPEVLKKRVMSPGGTTEQAIRQFEKESFGEIVERALLQAWKRSYTLAGEQVPDS